MAKEQSSKLVERGAILGRGMFPSPSARGLGGARAVNSPSGVLGPGQGPATDDLERFMGLQSRSCCRFC